MNNISYQDFVNDLSNILISYLEPLNLQFVIDNQPLTAQEVFMKAGCMAMFLQDKQDFIDYNLRHKKISFIDVPAVAKIHSEVTHDSYFGFKIDIIHNLVNNDLYGPDTSLYDNLLYSLAYKILSEKDFVAEGGKVSLDHKYTEVMNHFQKFDGQQTGLTLSINGDKA